MCHGRLSWRRVAPVLWTVPQLWGTHGYGSEFQWAIKSPYGSGCGCQCSVCIGSTSCARTHGVGNGVHEVASSTGKCADHAEPFAGCGGWQATNTVCGCGVVPKRVRRSDDGTLSRRHARISTGQHAADFLIAPSLNLNGPWEQNNIETIQGDYAEGQLRYGNGILQWFISMHDIKQPEKQMALRADLQKTKFTTEMSCLQMLEAMHGIVRNAGRSVEHHSCCDGRSSAR